MVPKYLPHQGRTFFDTVRQDGNPISANSRKKTLNQKNLEATHIKVI